MEFPRAQRILVVVACVIAAGCAREGTRYVTTRLMDRMYGASASAARNTATYPCATIAGETRPVLSVPRDPLARLTRTHASVDVDVEPGSLLDFGFGVRIDGTFDPDVEFVVAAKTEAGARTIFRHVVDGPTTRADTWHDVRVDLGAWTGRLTLSFFTQSAVIGIEQGRGGAIAYFSEPVITAPSQSQEARPNVILISLDTLGAKHLGIYGYQRDTSPNLDRIFSREGVVVERFYVNAVTTNRSHASMMTGYLPSAVFEGTSEIKPFVPGVLTLAEGLRDAGYRTAAFTEDAWVGAGLGFSRGFEIYNEEAGIEGADHAAGYIEQTLSRGLAWLQKHADEPFFLFLHSYQVHNPYLPPDPYRGLFPIADDADEAVRDATDYDREIRYTDDEVGRFIDALNHLGLRENTVLIVTSDHGEEFGEHGRRYHGTTLHEETVRVPFLIRAPGLLPAGLRRSGPMSMVDLAPTLLELLGLRPETGGDGTSRLAHLVSGTSAEAPAMFHEANAATAFTYDGEDRSWVPSSYAVTLWPYRAIRVRTATGKRCELYDLANDPDERTDISVSPHEERLDALCARLEDYEASQASTLARLQRSSPFAQAATTDAAPSGSDSLSLQQLNKLKALGYLQ